MPSENRLKRLALWKKDPKCVLCGVVTIDPMDVCKEFNVAPAQIYSGAIPPERLANVATLDHVRVDGKTVSERLACMKCNQNREDGPGFNPRAAPRYVAQPQSKWMPSYEVRAFFRMNFWTLVSMGLLAVMAYRRG